jgi:hypothetical protein
MSDLTPEEMITYLRGFYAGQQKEKKRILKLLEEEPRIFEDSLIDPNLLIEAINQTL